MNQADVLLLISLFATFGAVDYSDAPLVQRHIQNVELGVHRIYRWRANARVRDELSALSVFSYRAAAALFAAVLVTGWLKLQNLQHSLAIIFAGCVFARVSFRWTFDHAATLKPILRSSAYPLCVPWCMLLLDIAGNTDALVELVRAVTLDHFAITSSVEAAIWCSAVLIFVGIIYYVLTWVVLALFPVALLCLLVASRWIAALSLKYFHRNLCKYIALGLSTLALVISWESARWPG